MKYIFLTLAAAFFNLFGFSQPLSVYSLRGADSQTHSFSSFLGKKILIVVLPSDTATEDSKYLAWIDSIGLAHTGSLQIVAVPSFDDGYVDDTSHAVVDFYRTSLNNHIIITHPLFTHVSSGPSQDSLFAWLTHSTMNQHFDYEVTGAGTMFFIDGQGDLAGILGPESKFSNKIIRRLLD